METANIDRLRRPVDSVSFHNAMPNCDRQSMIITCSSLRGTFYASLKIPLLAGGEQAAHTKARGGRSDCCCRRDAYIVRVCVATVTESNAVVTASISSSTST